MFAPALPDEIQIFAYGRSAELAERVLILRARGVVRGPHGRAALPTPGRQYALAIASFGMIASSLAGTRSNLAPVFVTSPRLYLCG